MTLSCDMTPVSYTHLDVYKRQAYWPPDHIDFFEHLGSSLEAELARYHAVIFFESAAVGGLGIEGGNPTRIENIAEAAEMCIRDRYSRDTTDPARKEAYMHMVREVMPKARAIEQVFKERLLATGWEGPGMEEALRQFRAEAALFRAENLPLMAETQALGARYDEIIGGLTVQFDGAEPVSYTHLDVYKRQSPA